MSENGACIAVATTTASPPAESSGSSSSSSTGVIVGVVCALVVLVIAVLAFVYLRRSNNDNDGKDAFIQQQNSLRLSSINHISMNQSYKLLSAGRRDNDSVLYQVCLSSYLLVVI